jgi:hypothetical protein
MMSLTKREKIILAVCSYLLAIILAIAVHMNFSIKQVVHTKDVVIAQPVITKEEPTQLCEGIQKYIITVKVHRHKKYQPVYITCGLCKPERGWKFCK